MLHQDLRGMLPEVAGPFVGYEASEAHLGTSLAASCDIPRRYRHRVLSREAIRVREHCPGKARALVL